MRVTGTSKLAVGVTGTPDAVSSRLLEWVATVLRNVPPPRRRRGGRVTSWAATTLATGPSSATSVVR